MQVTWLHVSDFHVRGGDPYDRDLVLKTLVNSVDGYRKQGRAPDLILATGDIAFSGKAEEYKLAERFFVDLLDAAKLERHQLFVIPGNHDVDRDMGEALKRTLATREEADKYFNPTRSKPHLSLKMAAFAAWYNQFFKGIRAFPADSSCNVEPVEVRGHKLAVLSINSALFCQDDEDHNKLFVGRRCLDLAREELKHLGAELNIALMHHPLDWLSDLERTNIKANLMSSVQFVLRGHLHETEAERVDSGNGQALFLAAGAAYQTRKWPNCAMYATLDEGRLSIFPIRYEDKPSEVWTTDPSVFPEEAKNGFAKSFPLPGVNASFSSPPSEVQSEPAAVPRFLSNVLARRNLELVGREDDLEHIFTSLGEPDRAAILALHGHSGAGKSELALEFARRYRERYPGGTFVLDASGSSLAVEFARIGKTMLGLSFPADFSLPDQGQKTFFSLGAEPVLLIYDNVTSFGAVKPWLPATGMKCQVLITCIDEQVEAGWLHWEVKPLSREDSLRLIEQLGGREVAKQYGEKLADLAGGLPIQICPAALTLAYEERRGRLTSAQVSLAREANKSFCLVYDRLEHPVRLLLHSAAFLNPQRIPQDELFSHLSGSVDWKESDFQKHLDVCLDLHLLDGNAELKMNQLLATFLLGTRPDEDDAKLLERVRQAQSGRFSKFGEELAESPARADLAAILLAFPVVPERWEKEGWPIPVDEGETTGRALNEIGRFDEARPWYERAVTEKEKGDAQGCVDHGSLGASLHQVGYCFSSMGEYDKARPWYERAVAEKQKGDLSGQVDHDGVGSSLHQVGYCFSGMGRHDEARPWYERAVVAEEKGDVHGRVNHEGVGSSLHQVGYCFSGMARYDEARHWYERAVAEKQKGDLFGRVDHTSLGTSMSDIGTCLIHTAKYDEARFWFEHAVAAAEKGDVHGRVNHDSLGIILHQVGFCFSGMGRHDEARPWYERAVVAEEKGDVHGRVNHEAVGRSLHQIGICFFRAGSHDEAGHWFACAVEAKRKGDIFGRIDGSSLAISLRLLADCLRNLDHPEKAAPCDKEAGRLELAQGARQQGKGAASS